MTWFIWAREKGKGNVSHLWQGGRHFNKVGTYTAQKHSSVKTRETNAGGMHDITQDYVNKYQTNDYTNPK